MFYGSNWNNLKLLIKNTMKYTNLERGSNWVVYF